MRVAYAAHLCVALAFFLSHLLYVNSLRKIRTLLDLLASTARIWLNAF